MRLARADSTCDVVAEEEFVLLEEVKNRARGQESNRQMSPHVAEQEIFWSNS
jgi:hypothetical protein